MFVSTWNAVASFITFVVLHWPIPLRHFPSLYLLYNSPVAMFQSFFSITKSSLFNNQVRWMSKRLSKGATKRQPLTTKKAGKGFYKGNQSTSEGHITSKARFVVDPLKRMHLVVPNLEGFNVSFTASATWCKLTVECFSVWLSNCSSSHTSRRQYPNLRQRIDEAPLVENNLSRDVRLMQRPSWVSPTEKVLLLVWLHVNSKTEGYSTKHWYFLFLQPCSLISTVAEACDNM